MFRPIERNSSTSDRRALAVTPSEPLLVDPKSSYFDLYFRPVPLDRFLTLASRDLQSPPDFSASLELFHRVTSISYSGLQIHSGIKGEGYLARIANHTGPVRASERGNGQEHSLDTTYPPLTPQALFNLARAYPGVPNSGRLIVFYDSHTGEAVLRRNRKGFRQSILEAQNFLVRPSASENAWRLDYMQETLRDWYYHLEDCGMDLVIPEESMNKLTRRKDSKLKITDIELGLKSKLGFSFQKILPALGLVPLYLVFPPRWEDVLSGDLIEQHIASVYT